MFLLTDAWNINGMSQKNRNHTLNATSWLLWVQNCIILLIFAGLFQLSRNYLSNFTLKLHQKIFPLTYRPLLFKSWYISTELIKKFSHSAELCVGRFCFILMNNNLDCCREHKAELKWNFLFCVGKVLLALHRK